MARLVTTRSSARDHVTDKIFTSHVRRLSAHMTAGFASRDHRRRVQQPRIFLLDSSLSLCLCLCFCPCLSACLSLLHRRLSCSTCRVKHVTTHTAWRGSLTSSHTRRLTVHHPSSPQRLISGAVRPPRTLVLASHCGPDSSQPTCGARVGPGSARHARHRHRRACTRTHTQRSSSLKHGVRGRPTVCPLLLQYPMRTLKHGCRAQPRPATPPSNARRLTSQYDTSYNTPTASTVCQHAACPDALQHTQRAATVPAPVELEYVPAMQAVHTEAPANSKKGTAPGQPHSSRHTSVLVAAV